jgi:hypothetical protein
MKRTGDGQAAGWRLAFSVGLLFAFSPTLIDLFEHCTTHPWARASLIYPWLAWIGARHERGPITPARWGWLAVAIGLLTELAGIAGNFMRLGRMGLVLAAIGLCRGSGWASARVSLLLLWALPVPHVLIAGASPTLESCWGTAAAGMARLAGLPVEMVEDGLSMPGGTLGLHPIDGGIALAVLLAGLGWFRSLRCSQAPAPQLLQSLLFGISGFPIQIAAVTLAAILLGLGGDPATLRLGLDVFPWLSIWGAGFFLVWHTRDLPAQGESAR